jgi:hypothetical protein
LDLKLKRTLKRGGKTDLGQCRDIAYWSFTVLSRARTSILPFVSSQASGVAFRMVQNRPSFGSSWQISKLTSRQAHWSVLAMARQALRDST